MAHGFFDEVQIQIGMAIEQARTQGIQMPPSGGQNVARRHIGRIANDGGKSLAWRIGKKVAIDCPGRAMSGIELQGDAIRDLRRKRTITARWLQNPACVFTQCQHALNNGYGREYLAQDIHIVKRQGFGRGCLCQCQTKRIENKTRWIERTNLKNGNLIKTF